jgi:hypothetical protein
MAAYYARRVRLPMEVSLVIGQSISGDGNAPRQKFSSLVLRLYNQLF